MFFVAGHNLVSDALQGHFFLDFAWLLLADGVLLDFFVGGTVFGAMVK